MPGDEAADAGHRAIAKPGRSARRAWMRPAAVLVSLAASLAVLELATRLLLPHRERSATSQVGDGSDLIAHHQRLGWTLKPGASLRQTSAEFDVAIATNAAGEREGAEYAEMPMPGTPRVLALGDSFTFGFGVEQPESYPELLERSLAPLEVINLGVPGYGIDQMLLLLRDRGTRYRPNVVLVGLFEGAVFRDARDYQLVYPKPRFVIAGGDLELTNVPVPPLDAGARRSFPLASLALLGTRTRDLYEHLGYGEAWPVTERILIAMRDTAAAGGARLLVALIPKDHAVHGHGWRSAIHLRTLAHVARLLERNGIDFVDTTPALAAWVGEHGSSAPPYYSGDGHWTATGHRVAARAIEQPLQRALARAAGASRTE